jgi:hypothetical protein
LKDQLLHMYMVERKTISKWHLRLCKRPLKSAVLNSVVVYRQVTGRYTEQLSCRIQLVEGLFTKYVGAAQTRSVRGRHASDHTVPRLTERHFLPDRTVTFVSSAYSDMATLLSLCMLGVSFM